MSIRSNIRHHYLTLAGAFRKPKPGVYILNGHFIKRNCVDGIPFNRQLHQLKNMTQLVNIETAVLAIDEGYRGKETLVAFTFDDGFEECYTHIGPELQNHGVNAAFFVNPGFVEGSESYREILTKKVLLSEGKRPMNWEQIKSLHSNGFVIGNHTFDHVRLDSSDEKMIEDQIRKGKEIIEEHISTSCEYFAYPFGQLSDLSEKALCLAEQYHRYIFSGASYEEYYSCDGRVYNRRHFEGEWPINHLKYFLSFKRNY